VVEVWRVELRQPDALVRRLEATLSRGEHERAGRLVRDEHRRRWIVAHGGLRVLLADRLGRAPEDLAFTTGEHGKPALDGTLRFSLSRSGDLALVALAEDREVGVDVERTDRPSDPVRRALTDAERRALAALPNHHLALLRIWCRKEALAKAIGTGLGWEPERFDTTAPGGYALVDLNLGPSYVGALAAEGLEPPAWREHQLRL
jgi:4'-phosphopantetheinyl transferase